MVKRKTTNLIYTVDEPDGTIYVLCCDGQFVASSPWPQPLELAYPDARRAGTIGGDVLNGIIPPDAPFWDGSQPSLFGDLLAKLRELKSPRSGDAA